MQVETAGVWEKLVEVRGNYQRHCSHALALPVTAQKLQIVVLATNGDPSAAIYEIRVY